MITVNGEPADTTGVTVADLVRGLANGSRGIAVAVNGEVIPRTRWPDRVLRDGDRVEVLAATQGG